MVCGFLRKRYAYTYRLVNQIKILPNEDIGVRPIFLILFIDQTDINEKLRSTIMAHSL